MTNLYRPLRSLREGCWFKLICGASFQHLPAVRSLALAYAVAGADCIDVAADPAVLAAAREGLTVASLLSAQAVSRGYRAAGQPWLMVSLNDGEDPHFRKAEFDPAFCPPDCPRPCLPICPVQAIVFEADFAGVVETACYGCGRCLAICPVQQITARSYVSKPAAVAPLVLAGVDAVEIHTQVGRLEDFGRLWQAILPYVDQLKLVSISCPDGDGLIEYLKALYSLISPLPCTLIWQTDGRPMSGDSGDGATRAAVKLGQKVLAADLPGYVQLAGGTNRHTVRKLKAMGLLSGSLAASELSLQLNHPSRQIAGVAYGSYARSILSTVLEELEVPKTLLAEQLQAHQSAPAQSTASVATPIATMTMNLHHNLSLRLEDHPELLWRAVHQAHELVSDLKPLKSQTASERNLFRVHKVDD